MTRTQNIESHRSTADAATAPTAAARLEHVNVTVSDPDRTATMLVNVFGWHIRWSGGSIHGGRTVHVGTDDDYLALYTNDEAEDGVRDSYRDLSGLNHIALVVDDLDAIEQAVVAAGYEIGPRYDYEPGRRFYFDDHDGIEFEIVSYR